MSDPYLWNVSWSRDNISGAMSSLKKKKMKGWVSDFTCVIFPGVDNLHRLQFRCEEFIRKPKHIKAPMERFLIGQYEAKWKLSRKVLLFKPQTLQNQTMKKMKRLSFLPAKLDPRSQNVCPRFVSRAHFLTGRIQLFVCFIFFHGVPE